MAKKLTADTLEEKNVSLEQLQAENARLKAEKDEMAKTISTLGNVDADPLALKYMNEVAAIKKSGRVDIEKIKVREFSDHKNISLWTRWGKRVGPMHRENALATLQRFYGLGIMLSTKQPTEAEVEEWKASAEGKAWASGQQKKRDQKLKTLKRGELEKILKAMSQQFGLTTDALINLKKANEVVSPSEGRNLTGV